MAFVEDDVAPHEGATEPLFLALKDFVAGDDDVVGCSSALFGGGLAVLGDLLDAFALFGGAVEAEDAEVGGPFPAFGDPGGDDGEGADDEEGAGVAGWVGVEGGEVGKEGEGLEGLAEAHFVAEDAGGAVGVEPEEEGEAGELVAFHCCGDAGGVSSGQLKGVRGLTLGAVSQAVCMARLQGGHSLEHPPPQ